MKRKWTNYRVDPRTFVLTWESSKSIAEVAERLAMPTKIVHSRASQYRRHGVKLKHHRPKRVRLDVAALNTLIEQCRATG